jgi:sugar phosphate isomerase/epimerase
VNVSDVTRRDFLKIGSTAMLTGAGMAMAGKSSPWQICVFSKHLQWLDYDDMAEFAAEIGFDGIDLTVRPGGHVLPENTNRDLPRAVKAIKNAGLRASMMTTAIKDTMDAKTENILATASDLGIGYYRMGYLKYDMNAGVEQSLKNFKSQLFKLAEMNQKYKIHGAYQNHAGSNVGAPVWDLWFLLKDLNPKWMGCQYDIRHATVEGANSWKLDLNLLKSHIKTIVIKDFKWEKRNGQWKTVNTPLGQGMVDFTGYFELLKKYQIKGPISLHFEYPLGGIERGSRKPSLDRQDIIKAMKRDLNLLRNWLLEYS